MTPGGMKDRLGAGETLVGAFANLGSALAVEAMALGGLDWILVAVQMGIGMRLHVA